MDVEIDEILEDWLRRDPGLFEDLSDRRSSRRGVSRIDVAARLEPPIESTVMNKEERGPSG